MTARSSWNTRVRIVCRGEMSSVTSEWAWSHSGSESRANEWKISILICPAVLGFWHMTRSVEKTCFTSRKISSHRSDAMRRIWAGWRMIKKQKGDMILIYKTRISPFVMPLRIADSARRNRHYSTVLTQECCFGHQSGAEGEGYDWASLFVAADLIQHEQDGWRRHVAVRTQNVA